MVNEFPLETVINGYQSELEKIKIIITATSIARKHDDIKCNLEISTTNENFRYPKLHNKRFSLISKSQHDLVVRALKSKYKEGKSGYNVPWDDVLQEFADRVLQKERIGGPVVELRSDRKGTPPDYLLSPILEKGQTTMIYGEGGVGKSYIRNLIAMCISMPWTNNPFKWYTTGRPVKALVLDYETSEDSELWRLNCLQSGLGIETTSIYYRRCSLPFVDEVDQIYTAMNDCGSELLIIDSVGVACAGDLNTPAIANAFSSALRELNTTVLLIHHTSKGEGKTKTPFGSAYFTTNCRSVWEVRKVQDVGFDEVSVALLHRKSNNSRLFNPIGLNIRFEKRATVITLEDAKENFMGNMSNGERIKDAIKNAWMGIQAISDQLDIKYNTVVQTLGRYEKKGVVLKNGNMYMYPKDDTPKKTRLFVTPQEGDTQTRLKSDTDETDSDTVHTPLGV